MSNWVIAALPLAGVVLGATLQFWLSRAAESDKHMKALRDQAYVDYLRAVAAAAHLRSDEELRDAHLAAADAKARIAVYGSATVIVALAQFEETGAVLNSDRSVAAFIALVSRMRPTSAGAASREIELVLVGPRGRRLADHTT
jgi:hypothetical protein